MPQRGIYTGIVVAGSGVSLLARLLGNDGNLLTQASLSSIAYSVYNVTDSASGGAGTLTVSSVIFDSLQQSDRRWRVDSIDRPGVDGRYGYNFAATLAASLFTSGGDVHQVDVTFTPASGEPFVVVWRFTPVETFG